MGKPFLYFRYSECLPTPMYTPKINPYTMGEGALILRFTVIKAVIISVIILLKFRGIKKILDSTP